MRGPAWDRGQDDRQGLSTHSPSPTTPLGSMAGHNSSDTCSKYLLESCGLMVEGSETGQGHGSTVSDGVVPSALLVEKWHLHLHARCLESPLPIAGEAARWSP